MWLRLRYNFIHISMTVIRIMYVVSCGWRQNMNVSSYFELYNFSSTGRFLLLNIWLKSQVQFGICHVYFVEKLEYNWISIKNELVIFIVSDSDFYYVTQFLHKRNIYFNIFCEHDCIIVAVIKFSLSMFLFKFVYSLCI